MIFKLNSASKCKPGNGGNKCKPGNGGNKCKPGNGGRKTEKIATKSGGRVSIPAFPR